ncbi:MAG: D-tyrosyl-tRNA(Tyr) deacylase [Oscillospiraceae bacterium]|jgi:D-tyrosyl-tRNA(Tyr) deacylase|nr:D-tyrosyl-tRNA(Tyr) deacylase [Oscillospiraceae bacterium]
MKAILQRVKHASVEVEGKVCGQIQEGLLILLGVGQGDTETEAALLAQKCAQLRIFCDENDKMNLSLLDISGEALVISNFTLYADSKKGRRPNYLQAAAPQLAKELYELFMQKLREAGVAKVEAGVFGAHMAVNLLNNGPVTIILDTAE